MPLLGDNANTTQGGMRPPKLREKLSSLVRRKGSTKSRSQLTTATTTTTTTTTRSSEDLYSVRTTNGVPLLDVNLERTRSYRLAEGWLEDEPKKSPSSPSKRRHGQGGGGGHEREPEKGPEDLRRHTKTPIAAMFSKSTDQLASTLETISFRKPAASVSTTVLPAANSRATTNVPSTKMTKQGPQVSTTRVPVPEPEPQPIRISLHHSIVEEPVVIAPKVSQSPQSRGRPVQGPWGIRAVADSFDEAPQRHSIRQVGLLRSVGDNTTGLRVSGGGNGNGNGNGGGSAVGDSAKRFSAPSVSSPVPVPVPEPTVKKTVFSTNLPRSSSQSRPGGSSSDSQRQSWQLPTSAPRTSQDGGMRPPPQRTLSGRPPSVALTSSRLSWIRDLENKSASSSSSSSSVPEIQRLKKTSGSIGVAGKLAMFEQIQKQTQPLTPAFISRSNSRASSRSRMSSAAFTDPIQHADGPGGRPLSFASTARTSIDSVTRESLSISNRNSGVMAYYDQGFREKMEGVAGGWAKKLEKLAGGGKEDAKTADQSSEASVQADSPTEATTPNVKSEGESEPEWKAPVTLPYLAEITGGNVKDDSEKEETKALDQPSEEPSVPVESKTEDEAVTASEPEERGPEDEKTHKDLPSPAAVQAAEGIAAEKQEEDTGVKSDAVEEAAGKSGTVGEATETTEVFEEVAESKAPPAASVPLPADVQIVGEEEPVEESGAAEEEIRGEKEALLLPPTADVQTVSPEEKPAGQSVTVQEPQA